MKLFIDTAHVEDIRKALELGILDGVTTNPSLIAREGRDFHEVIREITALVPGPVSVEVTAADSAGMVSEGRQHAAIAENVVVKIPMGREGLKATKQLASQGIPVNMTLIFSAAQALLAAKAGAKYVSPFIGRLDDIGQEGMALIAEIAEIFDNYDFDCEILTASVRHPQHVLQAAKIGAEIATVPFDVIEKMINHPLTDIGLEKFMKDWQGMKAKEGLRQATQATPAAPMAGSRPAQRAQI